MCEYLTLQSADFVYRNGEWKLSNPPNVPENFSSFKINQFICFNQIYVIGEDQIVTTGSGVTNIPKGNYTFDELATELPITITDGVATTTDSITFNNLSKRVADILGFSLGTVPNATTTNRRVNLYPNPIIYIVSKELGGSQSIKTSNGTSSVIGQAYLNAQNNYSLYFDYNNSPRISNKTQFPNIIDISFVDSYGRTITEINGFAISLEYNNY